MIVAKTQHPGSRNRRTKFLSIDLASVLGYCFGTMQKNLKERHATQRLAIHIRMFLFLGALFLTAPALGGLLTPTPQKKPQAIIDRHVVSQNGQMPLPLEKPDFARPSAAQLLGYGKPPIPAPRPLGNPVTPLSENDAALYRKIFAAQQQANWDKADDLSAGLTDLRLRGHVLYQRYMHPTGYRTSFDELRGWLDLYADHPGAGKIYRLALARMPENFTGHIRQPVEADSALGFLDIFIGQDRTYRSMKKRSAALQSNINAMTTRLNRLLARNAPTRAMTLLKTSPAAAQLEPAEYDILQAKVANVYMMTGNLETARELSIGAVRRSGARAPQAAWIAGLIAWRQGYYKEAAPLFEIVAGSPHASPWGRAAGAYWASRAYARKGDITATKQWLEKAADNPRTFYGLVARRALGNHFDFNWQVPELTAAHIKTLRETPAGQRAMALVDAGQYHIAERELRQIDPGDDETLREALLAFTSSAALPALSMRLAQAFTTPTGELYDAALYPLAPWEPKSGYKIDRALIHALMRQESKFDPHAENRSGATGLMQLMPRTANFIARQKRFDGKNGRYSLKDPEINLEIGQRYIENLLYQDSIGEDLFSLAIAYNAGPGNLRKWKRALADIQDDPLLFVESIPVSETRAFVERVMANYWIYRARLNQPTPSLDNVAQGHWPQYVRLDTVKRAAAAPKIIPQTKPIRVADGRNY